MTPNVEEIKRLSIVEKASLLEMLSQSLREDLSKDKNQTDTDFVIEPFSLEPLREFDFDNIGELIEEIEGDFHK